MSTPDPIDNIIWQDASGLTANGWNPNRVHKAELRLLEHSLLTTGWIQPILVNPNGIIIDGFHRWRLSQDSKRIKDRWHGRVPTAVLPVSDAEAMLITVRINRAKGTHVAVEMSRLVHLLLNEHGYTREQIAEGIGALREEVDLLAQEDVFTNLEIKSWAYSNAWYPEQVTVSDDEAEAEAADDEQPATV